MSIHIGSIIKTVLKSKNIDVTDFAHKINYTRSNAYKIFNKSSIDTQLLIKINKVLGENLFFYFINEQEIADYKNSKIKTSDLVAMIKDLRKTMTEINQEKNKSLEPKKKTKK
jgi:plasmid maintenance system antidote protein VapI